MTTLNDIPPFSITSDEGKKHYYDPIEFYKAFGDSVPVKRKEPSVEEALEYIALLKEERQGKRWEEINGWRRLEKFTRHFDWRDIVTETEGLKGLKSPDGNILLQDIFNDVMQQTNSIQYGLEPVPVSNGEALGLAIPAKEPVMLTPFIFQDIILERWEHAFYFVQSKETRKWGALKFINERTSNIRPWRRKNNQWVRALKMALPLDFDEIYEDEILTDCSPTLFWVVRKNDKLGILTPYHHTEAIYDGYDTDWQKCSFKLYRNEVVTELPYHGS